MREQRRRGYGRAVALTTVLATAIPGTLPAQNLITNPDFDDDLGHWYFDTQLNQQWTPSDADGCPSSGGLVSDSPETSTGHWAFSVRPVDCVPVVAGETLYLSVEYLSSAEFVRLYLTYSSDVDCFQPAGFSPYLDFDGPGVAWNRLSGSVAIPASGVAAVHFATNASSSVGAFTIAIDRAYLGRSDPVLLDDAEGAGICRWTSTSPP